MAQAPIVSLIAQAARARGVDPAAALAVARQEGLSGGIGDQGTSFGPFQLHYGGAYPQSAPHGAQASQAWATSPAGVNYALDQIKNVAGGLRGRQAIQAIVSRFERPANPSREIANALAAYGGGGPGMATSLSSGAEAGGQNPGFAGATPPLDNRRQLLLSLMNTVGQKQPDYSGLVSQLLAPKAAPQAAPTAGLAPQPAAPYTPHPGGILAELLHEGVGGPTHSTGDHIHVALTDPQAMLAAIQQAQTMGLSVGENPYVGAVAPGVHADHSYHYRQFPGLYNGRHLGEAIDVHGPNEVAFQQWVQRRYGR